MHAGKIHNVLFSVSAITNAVSVAPILLLWLLLRKDMHFFFWWSCSGCYSLVLLAALPLLLVFVLLTSSVLKQRELPATVSSFHVSVIYTAMLRTSIAAVVLGCFYLCPLDCDTSVMVVDCACLLYTSPSPRDLSTSRMPSSA